MSYLDELLSGYREGLAIDAPQPIQAVRAALTEADDPRQRGSLLGVLATALTADVAVAAAPARVRRTADTDRLHDRA